MMMISQGVVVKSSRARRELKTTRGRVDWGDGASAEAGLNPAVRDALDVAVHAGMSNSHVGPTTSNEHRRLQQAGVGGM
jgi:hypothetical protein